MQPAFIEHLAHDDDACLFFIVFITAPFFFLLLLSLGLVLSPKETTRTGRPYGPAAAAFWGLDKLIPMLWDLLLGVSRTQKDKTVKTCRGEEVNSK